MKDEFNCFSVLCFVELVVVPYTPRAIISSYVLFKYKPK